MYKAIIVDDEDIIVTGLSKLLPWQKYNCELVGTADNGEAALKLVRHYKPDILFTDIRMPGMDGLSLIAALRSEFPDMQITILSGYPDFECAQQAIRLGVSNYILKPSKMDELEEALKKMTTRLNSLPKGPAQAAPPPQKATVPKPTTPAAEKEEDNAGNFIISNAVKYIEDHYAEKLTLPDVAEQVYVSQWHLSKLISRTTGQSFSDLLNGVRIKQAKELLKDPSLKIWEISERVGFSDVTHFSRIFKKIEHKSANEYRNQLPQP
ncbi:response regulator [Ruminococcaceae bacterium OttesenSCG-928-A16]|nr:response regulator [Ruminococcaceae bacterium OttesenSCG-928-A16]